MAPNRDKLPIVSPRPQPLGILAVRPKLEPSHGRCAAIMAADLRVAVPQDAHQPPARSHQLPAERNPPMKKPANPHQPWVLLIEFPCHADAAAARDLLSEQFQEKVLLRGKFQRPTDGNIAKWRSTEILRAALSNRTFGLDEVREALLAAGYNGKHTNSAWLTRATRAGVIERLRPGEYRFLSTANHQHPAPEGIPCEAP